MPGCKKLIRYFLPLLLVVLLAASFAGCENEAPPEASSSVAESLPAESSGEASLGSPSEEPSEEPSSTPSGETSLQPDPPVTPPEYELYSFEGNALPAADDATFVLVNKTTDPALDSFLKSYEGTYPAVADTVYTDTALYVCVVYDAIEFYGAFQAKYRWYTFDPVSGTLGSPVSERPEAYVYDKNSYNQTGYFWVDYETTESGTPCPYVVLFNENGTNHTLCFEETALEYVRIIRQNDTHVVLSVLRNGERYYRILDRNGNVIAQLEWISDVSSITPLMFDSSYLYCKKDADEDFVYDTIGAIDLETGKYQDLLHVGNSDYWTYFADGCGIAIYDNAEHPDTIMYYATATQQLDLYPAKRRVNYLDTFHGTLYGTLQGEEEAHVFLWVNHARSLFQSEEGYSRDAVLIMGKSGFSVLDNGALTVYVQTN
ncbi:MAG: hypothetical protein IJX82_02445 [Clostridia bacterium]|nr:hypothetical protein [Clostridia bacterium]